MRKRTISRTSHKAATPGDYRTGAHNTHRLHVNLVFIPNYRRRVLTEPVATRLMSLLREAYEVKAWGLSETSNQPDHVHLLLQISPTDSVASVMP